MTRTDRICQSFTKAMRLIELGPSYNPIIPKRDGWQTTIVDHASRAALIEKYKTDAGAAGHQPPDSIEEVDIVWRVGSLADAFPITALGTFDGLIASHVGEHIPDLIGFFQSVATLLKPDAVFFLALPDKRFCFDFFQPLTTTGRLLDAQGETRHSLGTVFDFEAYYALHGDSGAWAVNGPYAEMRLLHPFSHAQAVLEYQPTAEYRDAHVWRFTPSSFALLILELNLLRLIPWAVKKIEPQEGVEFFAWLERRELNMSPDEIAEQRLSLLRETVMETKEQIRQLDPPTAVRLDPQTKARSTPSIAAIIPLYNGSAFIEEALNSVFAQTLPANEIIVVDDGSIDDGPDRVLQLAKHHPIQLLRKPNGGQGSARNFGVAHSRSELIAFLDQDDLWYPEHLAELVKPFLRPPQIGGELGWVYSDLDEVDSNGRMVYRSFLQALGTVHPKRSLIDCLREDMYVLPGATLISRKAFDAVGGFDERFTGYEDDDLFLRLFLAGFRNIFLKKALSKWRIHVGSTSYASDRFRRSRAIYAKKLIGEFPDDPRRGRYYVRDLLIPRFYNEAVRDYREALKSDDAQRIAETRGELLFLLEKCPDDALARNCYGDAVVAYHRALQSGDPKLIQQGRDDLLLLIKRIPGHRRKLFGKAIGMMSPSMAKSVFAARHYLRPLIRSFVFG